MPQEEAPVDAPSEPVMNEQPDIIQPAELDEQPRSAASILQSFRDDAASAYAQITAVDYILPSIAKHNIVVLCSQRKPPKPHSGFGRGRINGALCGA